MNISFCKSSVVKMESLMLFTVVCVCCDSVRGASISKTSVDYRLHLPRALQREDTFTVTAVTNSERKGLSISLVKRTGEGTLDPSNIPCLIKMYFPSGDSVENKITISSVIQGLASEEMHEDVEATDMLRVNNFSMNVTVKNSKIVIHLNNQYLINDCDYSEDISFLQVNGDIQKIERMNFILD